MCRMVERARIFATAAHSAAGQLRKYTNVPYIHHPKAVAALVEGVGGTEEMVCAAWLHDVVEDTKVTLDDIREEFGLTVRGYVDWLTDVENIKLNRKARKAENAARIAKAPPQAKTIKLADLIPYVYLTDRTKTCYRTKS